MNVFEGARTLRLLKFMPATLCGLLLTSCMTHGAPRNGRPETDRTFSNREARNLDLRVISSSYGALTIATAPGASCRLEVTLDRGTLYAEGRIVLFAPKGSPLKPDGNFADLRAALQDGRIQRFAIANPEHAPYGRAAEQALKGQGLWEAVLPKLVLGENVSQAAQFATSGSAQGGIFAYSLAVSPEVSSLGSYALIPAEWHAPLRQRMVLMKNASDIAKSFYAYIQSPGSRAIFRKYGFVLPGEAA